MFHYNLVCEIEIGVETYECHGSLYSPCQFRLGDKLTVPWGEATVAYVAWDIEVPGEAYLGLETVSLSNEHDWSTCGICPGMFNCSFPDLPWVTEPKPNLE